MGRSEGGEPHRGRWKQVNASIWWLAKGDLMTKTGYGYAKCLTVAGTATSAPLQEMFVLEHPETTVQQNRSKTKKRQKKKRGTKQGI